MYEMKSATMSGLANDNSGGGVDRGPMTLVTPDPSLIAATLATLKAQAPQCYDRAKRILDNMLAGVEPTADDQAFMTAVGNGDFSKCSTAGKSLPWWAWLLIIGGGTKVLGVW